MEPEEFHVGDVVCKRLQPNTIGRVLEIYNDLVRVSFPMSAGWYGREDLKIKTLLESEFQLDQ